MSTMRARSSRLERTEAHDLVDAVDELGAEEVVRVARQVRRHDQHDVGEVDRAALTVGEAAVVEQLQQDVEHLGVRLLDLVEQHDGVGPAPDGLGELAALVVADVARGRADEARRRSASPGTRVMSMRTIARSSSNRYSARARASSVLPTPVGPRNRKLPIGRCGSERPARERRMALATAVDRRRPGRRRAACEHAPRGGAASAARPPSGGRPGRRSTWRRPRRCPPRRPPP